MRTTLIALLFLSILISSVALANADSVYPPNVHASLVMGASRVGTYLRNLRKRKKVKKSAKKVEQNITPSPTPSPLSIQEQKEKLYARAPELVNPQGYINTEKIRLADLIGKKVILIDFWTYSCSNCQATFPYLTSWYAKYKDQGLEIIGVHTPEFEFEKKYENVVAATKKWGITYPVVQDNDYETWRAYQNRYWPRKYLIDIDGFIVFNHIGEGAYDETEKHIQEALKEREERLSGIAR